jgi:signal transduction histidine kinase/DNA-binding response OmpR family regulator
MNDPLQILLIDDNPDDRALAIHELRRVFFNLVPLEVGEPDAFEDVLRAGNFDLVITDYLLRWSTGLDVLDQLHARYPDLPVIMFTNSGNEEIAVTGMKRGLADYVVKSARHLPRLSAAVRGAWERTQARREAERLQQENAQLLEREQAARAAAEAAYERVAFLSAASAALATSLDYTATLREIAQLAVQRLATWSSVDVLSEDGELQRLAVAHADPHKEAFARELQERFVPKTTEERGIAQVLRDRRSRLVESLDPQQLAAFINDPDYIHVLQSLGISSVMLVPMVARNRSLGVITFALDDPQRRYTPDDLALAEELAHRAALAVDNARLYEQSQAAVRLRDVFLSVAAHELKTPLTALLGYVYLIQRRFTAQSMLNEADRRALTTIGEQAQRLNELVDTLLDVTRLQEGQLVLQPQHIDLCAVVQEIARDIQEFAPQHVIEATCIDQPVLVNGDPQRLRQVVQNVLHNAIKYSPHGGQVYVTVRKDGQHGLIAIRDHGIGIPAEAVNQLFERFYRASNVNPNQISGFGIGLYIVREIVQRHGGTVQVESVEGEGSTFTVCLPLLPSAATDGS